jgi:hypothetical protein
VESSHSPSPSRAALRELLLWCLPALLLGLALRIVLTVHLPYAFFHDDAPDFLTTPDKLLFEHTFELHGKKTFLVPFLFTVPFLLHLPALLFIPVAQHLLGLVMVVLVGGLVRLWFAQWKIFIVPLTVIAAANPFLLWYEHTLMAEAIFVFCTVLLALAGTLYALAQTRGRFIFFCIALVLEAGARPEGKLLFGFGLFLLVLVHWREGQLPFSRPQFRHSAWPRLLGMFVLAIVMHFLTKTSQAGLLLYTSVVRLTPTELKVAPGFDPYIAPLRAELQRRWALKPSFPKVRDRREVASAVHLYLEDHPGAGGKRHRGENEFCLKLAAETCRRNFFALPNVTYHKFRSVATESPAGLFDDTWLFGKQTDAVAGTADRSLRLSRGLTGRDMSTPDELRDFMHGHYGSVPWFNTLSNTWLAALNHLRFPDTTFKEGPLAFVYPGVPYYFLVAGLGLVLVMLRRGPLQPFHVAWGLALLAFFYTIILTANVRPRFRFVFEPFWYLYLGLLLDTLLLWVISIFRPSREASAS